MPDWSLKTKAAAVIALFAVYFSVALYLRHSYIPQQAPAGTVFDLKRPFLRFWANNGFSFYALAPTLDNLADSDDNIKRSPFVIYENDRPLGPAHSRHPDIAELGHGRFSHWTQVGFVFSSSDGTSPASNGRRYRVVLPTSSEAVPGK